MGDIQDDVGYEQPQQEQEYIEEHLEEEVPQEQESEVDEQPFDEYQTDKSPAEPHVRRHKSRDRIKELTGNVWKLLEESRSKDERLRQLEAEKASLGEQLRQSADITLNHYDNSANLRLERAKQRLVTAEEVGDISAKADAIEEIGFATAEAQRAREWKAKFSLNEQSYKDSAAAPAPTPLPVDERFGQAWVQNNPWYNPSNRDYQPLLAEPVRKYAAEIDQALHANGQGHLIYSPQYFSQIEAYAQNVGENLLKNRGLNMQQGNGSVASVNRNSAGRPASGRVQMQLTREEKDMARNFGKTEEEYAKYLNEDRRDKSNFYRDLEMAKRSGRY